MDAGARARRGSPSSRGASLRVVGRPCGPLQAIWAVGVDHWAAQQSLGASAADGTRTRVTRRRRDGGAPRRPGSHLSPVRREAPPVVEPADEESVIEIPPEVLAQQRVDALEAKLDALLNGGPRYQPVEKDEPLPKKEAWGRAEGCAAVSALFDARAHEVAICNRCRTSSVVPPIPESFTAFVQAQFQLTFRSKHITEEKLEAFCATVSTTRFKLYLLSRARASGARRERSD